LSSSASAPALFSSVPLATRHAVRRLYFDVDDTVTWQGQLPKIAADALYRARAGGLSLVAVTGRSASWGELLLRLFPLDAVVAETGAMCMFKRRDGSVGTLHTEPDELIRRRLRARREAAADDVLAKIPDARLALDNMGRVYDTAFDLVEDGPPLDDITAARIRGVLEGHGLTVAQSSVHINAWFGTFDKASMVGRYLGEIEGESLDEAAPTLCYVGDSTNDGAMFARTPLSVGVENIAPYLEALNARGQAPAFKVAGVGGNGFAAVVELLVAGR